MFRARLLRKTAHYLWRDIEDIAREIIIPGVIIVLVIVVGLVLSALGAYFTTQALEITDPENSLPVVFLVGYGFAYYGLCRWIYGAFEKAQLAIFNENQEIINNIKDPK